MDTEKMIFKRKDVKRFDTNLSIELERCVMPWAVFLKTEH
jgi:hypothetical protein